MSAAQLSHLIDMFVGAGIATCAYVAGGWMATARRAWLARARRAAILDEMRGEVPQTRATPRRTTIPAPPPRPQREEVT